MARPIHFLLADDDNDDRFFFNKALKGIPVPTRLTFVEDGERLMNYLSENFKELPDVLFLDLNMPRKNGSECLSEIKRDKKLKDLPVIIYSTSLHEHIADFLYEKGAHYYVRKTNIEELQKVLHHILGLLAENNLTRPVRDKFILNGNAISISR